MTRTNWIEQSTKMSTVVRKQDLTTEDTAEIVKLLKSALSCEFIVHFKLYKICNGLLYKITDPMAYDSLRMYKEIEWVHETKSEKFKYLLNLGTSFALVTLWVEYTGDFTAHCRVVFCDSREDLLRSQLNTSLYCKYLQETVEFIEIVVNDS